MSSCNTQHHSVNIAINSVSHIELQRDELNEENNFQEKKTFDDNLDETSDDDPIECVCEVTSETDEEEEEQSENQDVQSIEETNYESEETYCDTSVEEKRKCNNIAEVCKINLIEGKELSYKNTENEGVKFSKFDKIQLSNGTVNKTNSEIKLCVNDQINKQNAISSKINSSKSSEKILKDKDNISIHSNDDGGDSDRSTYFCLSISESSENESPIAGRISPKGSPVSTLISDKKIKQSPSDWIPHINNVNSLTENSLEDITKHNCHSVFIPEDTIKREEFADENEEHDNDGKSGINIEDSFNVKTDSEFNMLNFCIKLEKIDCTNFLVKKNVGNENNLTKSLEVISSEIVRKRTTSNRKSNRKKATFHKKKKISSNKQVKNKKNIQKDQCFENFKTSRFSDKQKKNINVSDRRSLRLLGKSPEKNLFLHEDRKRKLDPSSKGEKCHTQNKMIPRSDNKYQKSSFENVFLSNKLTPLLLNENITEKSIKTSKPFVKSKKDCTVNKNNDIFCKNTSSKLVQRENILTLQKYRKSINTCYECLCCDQRYYLQEQIKEHVKSHFPNHNVL